jgi:type I restriction enzyme R subunit
MYEDENLSEADTRAKLVTPALHASGWTEDLIRREESAGAVEVVAGQPRRQRAGRMDYTLRVKVTPDTQPVAVALIEVKRNRLPPGHGLDQAKGYATCERLNVQFVYSTNGYLFVCFDRHTGETSQPKPMSIFPAPAALRKRYEERVGFSLDAPAAKPLLSTYKGGEAVRRYYQDAAIRAVLEKIARCEQAKEPKRALLSLATGAGKTRIAVHLLRRIADAGQLRRALFVCDRDELRTQGLTAFQSLFGSDAAESFKNAEGENNAKNARVHVATFQTLGVDKEDGNASFLTKFYPPGHFSHIIVDECHRSAWGRWSEVLERNADAVHIGLTATPRKLSIVAESDEAKADLKITADNHKYFGEPVYEYGMAQAMEDGYLAACEIHRGRVNLDDTGITLEQIVQRNPYDAITGLPVSVAELSETYGKADYEDRILLPDRVMAMCADLFKFLLESGGPEQKTIIFCARDTHADRVAVELNNLYAAWCQQHGHERKDFFAFKCTAASSGNDQLPDFRGSSRSHFIATTVDLLSTGVDVPRVRNIVFFRYMQSPISFYQMVGRGTRIDEPTGKLMFRVYDYTGATELFGEEFITKPKTTGGEGGGNGGTGGPEPPPPPPGPVPVVDGFHVHITHDGRKMVASVDGRAMPITVEEYKERLAARLVQDCPDLDSFRQRWVTPPERQELLDALVQAGYSPNVVRLLESMNDYDLYDVLADLGYGLAPRTRHDRMAAFSYKNEAWLLGLPARARAAIQAIAEQFELGGTDELESKEIFSVPAVKAAGGVAALKEAGQPGELLRETKERMFAA